MRRSALDRHGLLDESLGYCMDYELWLRLGRSGARFHLLERKLAGSRMYPDNKTLRARVKVHAEINDMFRSRFGRVPDKWIMAYAEVFCRKRFSDRLASPLFARQVAFRSISASLKWNGRVSPNLWRIALLWMGAERAGKSAMPAAGTPAVSREDVVSAYRLILGREPESEDVIRTHLAHRSLADLRATFLESREEFRDRTSRATRS